VSRASVAVVMAPNAIVGAPADLATVISGLGTKVLVMVQVAVCALASVRFAPDNVPAVQLHAPAV
jgi:hypothetical protein